MTINTATRHAPDHARHRSFATQLAAAALALLAGACGKPPDGPPAIKERGVLRVATLNSPGSWYLGAHDPEGLEFELASAFAKSLGIRLEMAPLANEAALLRALREHRVDVAAAQLSANSLPDRTLLASQPYDELRQVIVIRDGDARPARLADLVGRRLVVRQDSPQAQLLTALRTQAGLEALQWRQIARSAGNDALGEVAAGSADAALVDATDFDYTRAVHPQLKIAFPLRETRPLQWLLPAGAAALRSGVDEFLAAQRSSGALLQRKTRLARLLTQLAPQAMRDFNTDVTERLPALQVHFEQASVETGLDWRLIAALAYQESGWDPRAESANGAQGLMMLMPETSAELAVRDPFDARANVLAGARYFLKVRDMVPQRIAEPDRSWFAVAAYNMGFGHLEDARVLTQSRGGNPDRWAEVRANLPLLSDESSYLQLKHGYARGWEARRTVDRVQQFVNLLEWRGANPPQPPATPAAANATPGNARAGAAARR